MNHPSLPIMTAALLATLLFACKTQEPDASKTQTTSATVQAQSFSREDREFVNKAARGGELEVRLGREVSQKASSPDVKAFAKRMVTDHTKANDELKELAAKKGLALPAELDKDHQEKLDEMSKLSGNKLDREYADDMVEDHEEDVDEFRDAAKEVKDPDLRAFIDKTLPVLEDHLAAAKQLKAKTK